MKKIYQILAIMLLLGAGNTLWAQEIPQLVKEINRGTSSNGSSSPYNFFEYNTYQMYFGAYNGTNYGIYRTDGTEAGTVLRHDDTTVSSKFFLFNNYIYYYDAGDRYLCRFNDTFWGQIVKLGYTISDSFYVWGDKIYFYAGDSNGDNVELWVSDGTTSGTTMLQDINPGVADGIHVNFYRNFVEFNNKLFFVANDGVHGFELWSTDGTADGTQMVKDINPGSNTGIGYTYGNLEIMNNRLYFIADDGVHGVELWKTDGTAAGTTLVKDINPGDPTAFYMGGYLRSVSFGVLKKLLFSANDGSHGVELWSSDGTSTGTVMLNDINAGENSSISFYKVDGIANLFSFYFAADDGTHGRELWKTNGTPTGTSMVKDILPGAVGSMPITDNCYFESYHNKIYFRATPTGGSYHMFCSDGTADGTEIILPAVVTEPNPSPSDFFSVGNRTLYFRATYTGIGEELYKLEIPYQVTTAVEPGIGGNAIGGGPYLVGDTVTLTALPVQNYEFVNWTNDSGTEVSTDAVYTFIMPSVNRTYTAHFKSTLGVKEENVLGLTLYPNPANEQFFVEGISETTRLTIYQLNGTKVLETTLQSDDYVNITTLSNGLYIGVFENDKGKSSLRIVKE